MSSRLWYCDNHSIPLPDGHKFPMVKYGMVRERLTRTRLFRFDRAPPAPEGALTLAHDPAYVSAFLQGNLDRAVLRRIGFPWSEGLVRRSLASVGGTMAAAIDALDSGWGGNLAGGTHHACRTGGSGFCVFNDLAVAVLWLRTTTRIRRAAIVDLDVHQGDGTAEIFEHDPAVLTLSLHGERNFPFHKRISKIDVALADGTGDDEYLAQLKAVLPRVFEFQPDLVFYQSGVDPLASDTLGRLSLTHDGLMQRDRLVASTCRSRAVPLVITLGGGYSQPIELTAEAHANTFVVAATAYSTSALNSSLSVK